MLLLRGDEAPKLIAFRDALGLSDEEIAPVHIEVARRLFRQVRVCGGGGAVCIRCNRHKCSVRVYHSECNAVSLTVCAELLGY